MSNKTCLGCGGMTNTAVCDYLHHSDWQPRKCYARFEDGRWVKGCGYDEANQMDKQFVDHLTVDTEGKR